MLSKHKQNMEEQDDENLNAEETEEDSKIKYTLPQRLFIYKSYVKNESTKVCRREFRKAFPNIRPPSKSRIIRLVNNFETTGLLLDVKKIEDRHIEELENEAEENKKRNAVIPVIPSVMEKNAVDQNSVSEEGAEDLSCIIKTEIKSEPSISPEHVAGSNGFEFMPIKKEEKDGGESSSSSSSDEPSVPLQSPDWGLLEENPTPSLFPTPDTLPYPCRDCGYGFRTYADLKTHISDVHTEMVRCGECGKEFLTQGLLQKHEMQHTMKPPFVCVQCNKEFQTYGGLKCHTKKTHVKREKPKPKEEKKKKEKKKKYPEVHIPNQIRTIILP